MDHLDIVVFEAPDHMQRGNINEATRSLDRAFLDFIGREAKRLTVKEILDLSESFGRKRNFLAKEVLARYWEESGYGEGGRGGVYPVHSALVKAARQSKSFRRKLIAALS